MKSNVDIGENRPTKNLSGLFKTISLQIRAQTQSSITFMTLSISEILLYDGDVVQIALNYIVLIVFGFVHMFICFFAPVNQNSKIVERVNFVPLYLTFFGIQIGFYHGVDILGVSIIWACILGYLSRQMVFYWLWMREQRFALMFFCAGIIFAAVAYLQCAVDTNNTSTLWADVVGFCIGFILSMLVYWHVRSRANCSNTLESYGLHQEIERLELVCQSQARTIEKEMSLRKQFEKQIAQQNRKEVYETKEANTTSPMSMRKAPIIETV